MAPKSTIESLLVRRYGQSLLQPSFAHLSPRSFDEASHECVKQASQRGQPKRKSIATRLFEGPVKHTVMGKRACGTDAQRRSRALPAAQRETMLSASFALIHRKALFEYLREKKCADTRAKH